MDCPTKVLLPKRIASISCPFGNGQVEILGRTSDWSGLGQESTPWEGKVEHLDRQALQWIPSNSRVLLPKEDCTAKGSRCLLQKGPCENHFSFNVRPHYWRYGQGAGGVQSRGGLREGRNSHIRKQQKMGLDRLDHKGFSMMYL